MEKKPGNVWIINKMACCRKMMQSRDVRHQLRNAGETGECLAVAVDTQKQDVEAI
jgi:hypothetical protein